MRTGVGIAEDLAKHSLIVLVGPEAAIASGAVRLVSRRTDDHAPSTIEHTFKNQTPPVVYRRVAADVPQDVRVRSEAHRKPIEHRQHLVIVRAETIQSRV